MGNSKEANIEAVLEGTSNLLTFGPLGLSALLFLLATSVFFINLPPARARLLTHFIYVGAILSVFFGVMAFVPSLVPASAHNFHMRVEPLELIAANGMPQPVLRVNSEEYRPPLKITVDREMTGIIDVSEAMESVDRMQDRGRRQFEDLMRASELVVPALRQLEEISALTASLACPGGAHGILLPQGNSIKGAAESVSASLRSWQSAAQNSLANAW